MILGSGRFGNTAKIEQVSSGTGEQLKTEHSQSEWASVYRPTRPAAVSWPQASSANRGAVHLISCSKKNNTMAFMFEKLDMYQKAVDLVDQITSLTETFPRGYYFLRDKLDRAELSVATNIAEGNGRFTKNDRKNFFAIAPASVPTASSPAFAISLGMEPAGLARRIYCNTRSRSVGSERIGPFGSR